MIEVIVSDDKSHATLKLYGQMWQRQDMEGLKGEIKNLRQEQIKNIILDLHRLSFVDSEGVGAFVGIFNDLREIGGKLVLFQPNGSVQEVLELAVIDSFIPVIYDEPALEAMKASF